MATVRDSNSPPLSLHVDVTTPTTAPESFRDRFCIPICKSFRDFVLITTIVTNAVYSIIALIETSHKDIQDLCPNSNLWSYLLIILVLGSVERYTIIKAYFKTDPNYCEITSRIFIQVCLLMWGVYELWGIRCANKIKSNFVHTMAEINVFAHFAVISIAMVTVHLTPRRNRN
jgi:hypothetical protein